MSAATRGKYQGVWQIVRFNRGIYLTAALALLTGCAIAFFVPLPNLLRTLIFLGVALASFWLLFSLAVSHHIYDRSRLYEGDWLSRLFSKPPSRYATLHAGLDEFSTVLRSRFPESDAITLDFFDAQEMTEPSILRARNEQIARAKSANVRALPFRDQELDAVFLIFAAHELRKRESRIQFFKELRRSLKPNGTIILVEHLRDLPNFVAFGPGFLHFHSHAEWLHCLTAAGLQVQSEFPLTRFVRGFVLRVAA